MEHLSAKVRDALKNVALLPSEEVMQPLKEKCTAWSHWLDDPQKRVAIIASKSMRSISEYRELVERLQQLSSVHVLLPDDGEQLADVAVYLTMATSPWREEEAALLKERASLAPLSAVLLLHADTLDDDEQEDALIYAQAVFRSILAGSSKDLVVTADTDHLLHLIADYQISLDERAVKVYDALRAHLAEQLEILQKDMDSLNQQMAQERKQHTVLQNKCAGLQRTMDRELVTMDAQMQKLFREVQLQYSQDILSLQSKYHSMCYNQDVMALSEDITNGLKQELHQVVLTHMRSLKDRILEWGRSKIAAINSSRQDIGLMPLMAEPESWIVVHFETITVPNIPLSESSQEVFSHIRGLVVGLVSGATLTWFFPALALPAGIAMWLGLEHEQKQREAEQRRAQLSAWVDQCIFWTDKRFHVYMGKTQEMVIDAAKGMYSSFRNQTLQDIQKHMSEHPLHQKLEEGQQRLQTLKNRYATLQRILQAVEKVSFEKEAIS